MKEELQSIMEKLSQTEQQCLLELAHQIKDGTREKKKLKVCSERCKMIVEYTDYELAEKCLECPINAV